MNKKQYEIDQLEQVFYAEMRSRTPLPSEASGIAELAEFSELSELSELNNEERIISDLLKKLESVAWFLRITPFVKEMAICNNLSFGLVNDESDIDLFVILEKDRFFMGRLFLTVGLHLLGKRRYQKKIKGRICLSFFVADSRLNLQDLRLGKNDFYFYFWFKNLFFLRNDSGTISRLLQENRSWFFDDFSSRLKEFVCVNWIDKFSKRWLEKVLSKFFGMKVFDFIENGLKKWQLKRALKKNDKYGNPVGVVIEEDLLKFHVLDVREEINENVLKRFAGEA